MVEDISGECRYCRKEILSSDMEDHFTSTHYKIQNNDNHEEDVLEILLNIIDLSVTKVDTQHPDKFTNIQGGGIDKAIKEDKVNVSDSGSEDDLTGEESEPEINPVYEYNYSEKEERYVGNKPSFLQAIEKLKQTFSSKEKMP